MVFRQCLCVVLLISCGYANKSNDYCRVLVNYDAFKASVDQFLTSRDETCGCTDTVSESKATILKTMDTHVNDFEKEIEKLSNDNKNKEVRVSNMEAALAKLTSELSVDCGSPTPPEGTDVVYSSTGLHAMASYRCKKGLYNTHPGQQLISVCQKDGNWTMVNGCVNISACWTAPTGRVLYAGTQSTSTTGKVCQRWDSQTPHEHTIKEDVRFWIPGIDTPQTVTGSANYCRDPDRTGSLWCYTTDRNTRWEKCDVPKCNI